MTILHTARVSKISYASHSVAIDSKIGGMRGNEVEEKTTNGDFSFHSQSKGYCSFVDRRVEKHVERIMMMNERARERVEEHVKATGGAGGARGGAGIGAS